MSKLHCVSFLLVGVLLFSSCRSKKTPSFSNVKGLDQIDFKYFSSKLKIDYNDGNQSIGLNASLRMKKDEMVWMTVLGPFGIKVGKLKLTQDSIFVLQDYPDKTYMEYSLLGFNSKYGTDVSVTQVQNLLLGNLMFGVKSKIITENGQQVVKQNTAGFDILNVLEGNKVKEVKVSSTQQQGDVQLIYSDYEKHNSKVIPEKADLKLNHSNLIADVAMQHKNINFTNDELDFPFTVSSKYVRK